MRPEDSTQLQQQRPHSGASLVQEAGREAATATELREMASAGEMFSAGEMASAENISPAEAICRSSIAVAEAARWRACRLQCLHSKARRSAPEGSRGMSHENRQERCVRRTFSSSVSAPARAGSYHGSYSRTAGSGRRLLLRSLYILWAWPASSPVVQKALAGAGSAYPLYSVGSPYSLYKCRSRSRTCDVKL